MSCDWDIWCLDCEEKHGFFEASSMYWEMRGIIAQGPAIVAAAEMFKALRSEDFHLIHDSGRHRIDLDVLLKHAGHKMVPRDECGRNYDDNGDPINQ